MTGARGRIGRAVAALLAADSRVDEVVAIDVRPPGPPRDGVREVERDTRDPLLVGDLEGADALVHLAFRVLDPSDAESVNVDGSRNAFDGAVHAGVATIVHASSGAVYGAHPDNRVPLREEDPLRPAAFAYPETKVRVERMLSELSGTQRVVILRPTTVLGPGAPLLLGRSAHVRLSDFDPPQQFTWVDDVAAAFGAALHSSAEGTFNVGAPGTVRTSEIARLLGVRDVRLPYRLRHALASATSRVGGLHPGFVEMARYPIVADSSKARAELGWSAELDSVSALRRFGEWLRSPSQSGR